MWNIKLLVIATTAAALTGCFQRAESPRRACENLNAIVDPVAKAELEKQCGRGGMKFKPTPKTREY